jgi:hypothetical protein
MQETRNPFTSPSYGLKGRESGGADHAPLCRWISIIKMRLKKSRRPESMNVVIFVLEEDYDLKSSFV